MIWPWASIKAIPNQCNTQFTIHRTGATPGVDSMYTPTARSSSQAVRLFARRPSRTMTHGDPGDDVSELVAKAKAIAARIVVDVQD